MARAWHLVSRPQGVPTKENFALEETKPGPLLEGMIRVHNSWLSVDPYMRGRMNDVKSYVPPFQLGEPMEGGAVGEVVESKADGFSPGDLVMHMNGWRDEALVSAQAARKVPALGAAPEMFLGILGVTGATAYFGLLDAASAKEGDVVFVSAAAGAVGSAVVQIAEARGMTVIGSAGGAQKCEFVRSLGADGIIDYRSGPILKSLAAAAPNGIDVYFDNVGGDHLDAALAVARNNARFAICGIIDYRSGPILKSLAAAAPNGIDVYFDNVGGDHLDAAFAVARNNARFAICGMIANYNDPSPPTFRFIARIIAARIRLKGFLVFDYQARMDEFYREMSQWVASGAVKSRETIVDGLENTPDAFLGLFKGENTGKMLVRL